MPRQDKQQITARGQSGQQQGGRQVVSRVMAQGADNLPSYIPQMHDPDLQGFMAGLSQFNPALQKLMEEGKEKEDDQGRVDRLAGKDAPEDPSLHYKRAYFQTDGAVRAQEDGTALLQQYNTEFDKDGGDLEKWLSETYQGRLKGIQDEDYLKGYNQGIAPALAAIRKGHLDYQKKAVEGRVESNAMQMLMGVTQGYITQDMPVPQEALANLQAYLGKNLGVSDTRFQELLYEATVKAGEDGHYEVFDILKQDRPDGSPGLYFNPAWTNKIEDAEARSYRAAEQRSSAARDKKQNESLYAVFAEEDPRKAQELYASLKKSGLFTRADDLIKWDKLMLEKVDGKPDANQLEREGVLLAKAYTGGLSYRDILREESAGGITSGQRKYLLSETRRVQHENRQAAAQEEKAGDSIYKTSEFRSAESYLKGMLKPRPKGDLDMSGEGNTFDRASLATATLELVKAAKGKSPEEIQPLADDIIKRHLNRRREKDGFTETQQGRYALGQMPFNSLQEVMDAARNGLLTPDEYRTYSTHFKRPNVR